MMASSRKRGRCPFHSSGKMFYADDKVRADLYAEIKRVLESAKWEPAVLGTRKVNCRDEIWDLRLSCSY